MENESLLGFSQTCISMSILSFWVFVIIAALDFGARLFKKPAISNDTKNLSGSDIPPTLEALSKLADSFTKAGPALSALVASLAFMALAAIPSTAGAITKHVSAQDSVPRAQSTGNP